MNERLTDSGDKSDISAVRRLLLLAPHEAISPVVVDSGYGMAEWFGNGGGEDAFAKQNGVWQRIGGGGGAFNAEYLVSKHVPTTVADRLIRRQLRCG